MELRLLKGKEEKLAYEQKLISLRKEMGGKGFKETPKSCLGKVHLEYGEIYALFDEASKNPNEMIGGMIIHDLATLPPSYYKPDLHHLDPERVVEAGELWSTTPGGAFLIQKAGAILLALREIDCFFIYPTVSPVDLRKFWTDLKPMSEPFEWPFVRTLDGGNVICQAMGLEGNDIYSYLEKICKTVEFESKDKKHIWFNVKTTF